MSEQTSQLAATFKEKLSESLEEGPDGKLKMTISIPDETVLDNIAKSPAMMVSAGN